MIGWSAAGRFGSFNARTCCGPKLHQRQHLKSLLPSFFPWREIDCLYKLAGFDQKRPQFAKSTESNWWFWLHLSLSLTSLSIRSLEKQFIVWKWGSRKFKCWFTEGTIPHLMLVNWFTWRWRHAFLLADHTIQQQVDFSRLVSASS